MFIRSMENFVLLINILFVYQEEARGDAEEKFYQDTLNKELQLNVEYRVGNIEAVTLLYKDSKEDVGQSLISEGLVTVQKRKEKRLAKIISDYLRSQEKAKKAHVSDFWCFCPSCWEPCTCG